MADNMNFLLEFEFVKHKLPVCVSAQVSVLSYLDRSVGNDSWGEGNTDE
jgi:hypothetical protein